MPVVAALMATRWPDLPALVPAADRAVGRPSPRRHRPGAVGLGAVARLSLVASAAGRVLSAVS